jgi:GT2 family glycosyltransferase
LRPELVVVVDASDDGATFSLVREHISEVPFQLFYLAAEARSAARQRNQGARSVTTDLLFFLDDDVVLEDGFISNIVEVFERDTQKLVGGVGGTVVNEVYTAPSRLNSLLLRFCIGPVQGSYAGRLLGPALNFLPADTPEPQSVDWLRSGCVAYRREVFAEFLFSNSFQGYSFAEDVHLSARIAKRFKLLSTGRARLYHKSLGGRTHRDWTALGEMIICNRHEIMVHVLQRRAFLHYIRLVLAEFIYSPAASMWNGGQWGHPGRTALMTWGKLRGLAKIITGRSPHDLARTATVQS